eukprot:362450-Chlamydomonas_euryale.AAC.5
MGARTSARLAPARAPVSTVGAVTRVLGPSVATGVRAAAAMVFGSTRHRFRQREDVACASVVRMEAVHVHQAGISGNRPLPSFSRVLPRMYPPPPRRRRLTRVVSRQSALSDGRQRACEHDR